MRIDVVKAVAFGPFHGKSLELGAGMNVIYGANESGKSSWHAAIYGAMCGMRRSRGQPTREDRLFASRHRPWRGSTWRVEALATLDDGRVIELDQGFGPAGRSVATEKGTKRMLTDDVVRDGSVDATSLLGLTRETALATVFVRQGDILRVTADASSLQEYLERATASSAVDTTADEALARIADYKREQVGVVRANARGPLAVASRSLKEAQRTLDEAEARFENYQELLARRRRAGIDLDEAEQALAEVKEHEQERLRRERWAEIAAAQSRCEQARALESEVATGPKGSGPGRDLVERITRALEAYGKRPPEPHALDGASAAAIQEELAALPNMPSGDTEPATDVASAHERWRAETQREATQDEIEPSRPFGEDPPLPPAELRQLADDLELALPEIDRSLVEAVEQARSTSTRSTTLTDVSTAAAPPVTGTRRGLLRTVVAAVVQPIVRAAAAFMRVLRASIGLRKVGSPEERRGEVARTTGHLGMDAELARLEARLEILTEARLGVERRTESALRRVAELSLSSDPQTLRQLAADADVAKRLEEHYSEWARRRNEIAYAVAAAADALRSALAMHGTNVEQNEDLDVAFTRYVLQCKERNEVARSAGRREDLEAQLAARRAAEDARALAVRARADAERELLAAASAAGCQGSNSDEVVTSLGVWLRAQEAEEEMRNKQRERTARLDQLLEGHSIADLESEITAMMSVAGEPPTEGAPLLKDRSAELDSVDRQVRILRDRAAELVGQLGEADAHLMDVATAVEAEARADSEVCRLTALAEDLDLATSILVAAQQKAHADIAPILNTTLRPWVPLITQGRYDDIRVNPSSLEIEVHETGGQFRLARLLSHGTTEQLFLLLRLALAEHLATTGESAPVILDDVTVQSDAKRTRAMLDLLHGISVDRQVILFSQEEEVSAWAQENLANEADRLIELSGAGVE